MSSGEGASQNRTATENEPIETCHKLLKSGDFLGVRSIVHMNQLESSKRNDLFEQARAICDVLIAAENRLPNGLMDCYGMLRVNRMGPVLLEDLEKLMKLLDKKQNHFPFCQEAADKALLAWSLLSKPLIKAHYDLVISEYHNRETQGNGRGGLCGEGSIGKRKMGLQESDDDDDDGQEIITMARITAKLCTINGRRVKLIPLKKKKTKDPPLDYFTLNFLFNN